MTTPTTGEISFTDIATETGLAFPRGISEFYAISMAAGGGGLMYHNLEMATGNTTSAKVAIFDQNNSGSNQSMSNWYNYAQDIGMRMTYLITNNSMGGVGIDVVLWDSFNNTQGTIFSGTVAGSSNTGTTLVDTGLLSQSMTAGYRVAVNSVTFQPPPGPGQTFSVTLAVTSASDTDGVGANTTRTTYGLGGYSQSGPPVPPPPAFTPVKACDDSGSTIPCNKRTTISITIT